MNYFADKLNQGLRVPISWTRDGANGPGMVYDGKVGMAFVQEMRFAKFVERLQIRLTATLDVEFKLFLKNVGIRIDDEAFYLLLPPPSNFDTYRQAGRDAELLNILASAAGIPQISARFALSRFAQLTEAEIADNERKLREEKGISLDDPDLLMKLYQPDFVSEGGGGGGGGLGDLTLDSEAPPPEIGGEGEIEGGEEGGAAGGGEGGEAPPEAAPPGQ